MRAALELVKSNLKVVIVTKSLLGKAHTVMAEGGIAASLGDVDPEDNWKVHFNDTVVEGVYIGDWHMAELLAKEAPDRVYELEKYGALFDRTPEGKIMQRAFGAHTYRRLCHVGDKTGMELIRTLEDQVLHKNVTVLDETIITRIFTSNGAVAGAIGLRIRDGKFVLIKSKATLVATGGCGRLYHVTSNSWESTGEGIALAFKAGATLRDMEMVQFHPTGMVWPPGVKGLLVTEGVRGEGGLLFNTKGERFMLRYSPQKKELDARDVVARAIHNEIKEGRGTEHGGVYLDIRHKGAAFIKKKLPGMYDQFKDFAGVDITKERMEVAPTVHYFMGGIAVDAETGATNVKGMYSAGEAAGGLHGANRLGGNSLADILVFGRRAGAAMTDYIKSSAQRTVINENDVKAEVDRVKSYLKADGSNPYDIMAKLRDAMSEKVGIIRTGKDLVEALDEIRTLESQVGSIGVKGGLLFNQGLMACIELENMLLVAKCIVMSALQRKESRGAHTRSDYPKKDPEFRLNITCSYSDGKVVLGTRSIPDMPDDLKSIVTPEAY